MDPTQMSPGKSIRCKAAVARVAGAPLVMEEIVVLPPQAWEVRVKILCTSLCHSDAAIWKMSEGPLAFFPRVFGHEAAGIVESVGDHVEEVAAGDLVTLVAVGNCGECKDCVSDKGNICTTDLVENRHGMPRDGGIRFLDADGKPIHHFFFVSSFSEYTVVDVTHVIKIDRDFPVDKACLLSCGVGTGVGAAWKLAQVEKGSTVAIFGLGCIGLAVAEGARLQGASKIIAVDINEDKFELGKKFGVTDFINPKSCGDKPVPEVIKEMTGGGADYCFECIGLASLMQQAFDSSRQSGGKTVVIGLEMHGTPLSIDPYMLLRGRSIIGCYYGGLKPKSDVPILAKKYLDKELNLDEFISDEIKFEEINKAFDLLHEGKSLRCIIWMED